MKKITKRFMHKSKQIMVRLRPFSLPVLILVVAISALVGVKVIFRSHAATQISTTTTNNSANRLVFWGTSYTPYYTDADLDKLKSWGVGGISFGDSYFYGMGGTENWTANLNDPTIQTSSSHQLEKDLINGKLISRAHARGIKVYLDQGVRNYYSTTAPLCNWTDDSCWNTQALPYFANMAGTLKALGADGVWFDTESFGSYSWNLNSTAIPDLASKGETAIRAEVKLRGNQAMSAMLNGYGSSPGYPNLDVAIYNFYMPYSWNARMQAVNGCPVDCYVHTSVQQDFLAGLASAPGYSHIRLTDASFYKSCQVSGCTWDSSNQYNDNSTMAYFSQYFSNWDYAASRISITPFVWIDNDYSSGDHFSATQSVAYVTDQMQEFRKWGMEGQFGQFNYHDPLYGTPDPTFTALGGWPAYVPAMQAASVLGTVDSQAPSLNITAPASGSASTSASSFSLSGNAHDDQAIWYVSWSNDRGGSGNFQMTWQTAGSPSSYEPWQMNFSGSIPLQSGTNNITVTAVDIHGNTTRQVVPITSGGTGDNPPAVSLVASPTTLTQGSATTLTATATDTDSTPVAKVEFYDGATLLGTSTAAPYSYTWTTTTSTSTGGHNLTAKAYDTANLNATSAAVAVTVNAPASGNAINDNTTGTSTNQFNYSGSPGTWTYVATNCAGTGITYQGDCHYNGTNGSYYQVAFTGTGVNVYSFKAGDAALLDIYIDGVLKQSGVDTYSPSIQASAIVATITGLTNAAHTLKVVANGKNAASAGFSNNADRVDVITSTTLKPGDVNGDGAVNITDLSILTAYFGQSGRTLATGDLNGDGVVNIIDLSILAAHWGT